MKNKIRIFLADDHKILRDGLRYIILSVPDYEIVGEAGDGKEALDEIEILKPDIVILDISMPTITGIEIAHQLKKYMPEVKIIILSKYDNEEYVYKLLEYGINGYVLKDNAGDDLLTAIKDVIHGNIYLSSQITNKLVNIIKSNKTQPGNDKPLDHSQVLSGREKQVLKLVVEGKKNTEIASILRISIFTVKSHRQKIMQKLNVHKTIDLVKYALKNGLVEL